MNPISPLEWMAAQRRHGLWIGLVLDPSEEAEALRALHAQLPPERWRSVYSNTAAAELAAAGPFLFLLEDADIGLLNALLAAPQRNWGWLAALPADGLAAWTEHWRQRLIVGSWPQQCLYRFHDNGVLGRALAQMPQAALAGYLGLAASVCYWQDEGWALATNPAPGIYPVPSDPAWLQLPPAPQAVQAIQHTNARRFLLDQHYGAYAAMADFIDPDLWLSEQLARAASWGWESSVLLEFFLVESMKALGFVLPPEWDPLPNESPATHLRRVQVEAMFWSGGGTL